MSKAETILRWRRVYEALLRLYPRQHRDRFAEPMAQTFCDVLHERARRGGVIGPAVWMLIETSVGIAREQAIAIVMRKHSIVALAGVVGLLLMVPLVAMQFTDEVNWSPFDFIAAGVMLFSAALAYELISRRGNDVTYRCAVALSVATGLFLIWSNLAVGVIGSENNPANLLYIGVFAVGILGAIKARLRPLGMAKTLFATALAQATVAAVALIGGLGEPSSGPAEIIGVNAFFVVLFAGSGLLFRKSADRAT